MTWLFRTETRVSSEELLCIICWVTCWTLGARSWSKLSSCFFSYHATRSVCLAMHWAAGSTDDILCQWDTRLWEAAGTVSPSNWAFSLFLLYALALLGHDAIQLTYNHGIVELPDSNLELCKPTFYRKLPFVAGMMFVRCEITIGARVREETFSTNWPADHFPLGVLPTEHKRELEEAMPFQLFIPRPAVFYPPLCATFKNVRTSFSQRETPL